MNEQYYKKALFTWVQRQSGGEVEANPIADLQHRHAQWAATLNRLDGMANVLGQAEEVGELIESLVGKLEEEDSFTSEKAEQWEKNISKGVPGSADDLLDAVADILVFTTGLCSELRFDFNILLTEGMALERSLVSRKIQPRAGDDLASIGWAVLGLAAAVGRIHHATLKHRQGIRGYDHEPKYWAEVAGCIVHVVRFCTRICDALRLNVVEIYIQTLEKVLKRNWNKINAEAKRE